MFRPVFTKPFQLFDAGAAAAFLPTGVANLSMWIDYSDITTLYQDSAKTTPVTADGDPIGAAADKSENNNDATQANAANKSVYKVNIKNSLSIGRYDGSASYMLAPDLTLDNCTVFIVAKQDSVKAVANSGNTLLSTRPLQTYCEIIMGSAPLGGEIAAQINDGSFRGVRYGTPSTNYVITEAIFDGDTPAIWTGINGSLDNTLDFGAPLGAYSISGASVTTIGNIGILLPEYYFDGDMCEILVYNAVVSPGDRTLIRNYLNSKWSIY